MNLSPIAILFGSSPIKVTNGDKDRIGSNVTQLSMGMHDGWSDGISVGIFDGVSEGFVDGLSDGSTEIDG